MLCATVKSFIEWCFPVTFFMCMCVCEHVHVNMRAQMCMCVWRSEGSFGCYNSWACPPCSVRKGLLVATVHWSGEANWLVSLRDLPFSASLVLGWWTCPTMPGFSTGLLKTQGHHASTARAFLAEPPSQASCSLLHADESAASVIPPSLHQQTLCTGDGVFAMPPCLMANKCRH